MSQQKKVPGNAQANFSRKMLFTGHFMHIIGKDISRGCVCTNLCARSMNWSTPARRNVTWPELEGGRSYPRIRYTIRQILESIFEFPHLLIRGLIRRLCPNKAIFTNFSIDIYHKTNKKNIMFCIMVVYHNIDF